MNRGRASIAEYIAFRRRRSEEALAWLVRHVPLDRKRVLDVGCGHGSLAFSLAVRGASVVAIDIDETRLSLARQHNAHERIEYANTELRHVAGQYDVITIFDVLEHVGAWRDMLKAARDRLTPGGVIYVEYNPFYSVAGHHLYDYTLMPVQWLPDRWTERLVLSRRDRGGIFSAEEALTQYHGLNGITPRQLRRTCRHLGLHIMFERNEMSIPGWRSFNTRLFRHVPYFEDLFSPAHIVLLQA